MLLLGTLAYNPCHLEELGGLELLNDDLQLGLLNECSELVEALSAAFNLVVRVLHV